MTKNSLSFRLMVPSEVNSLNVHSELTIDPERGHQSRSLEVEIPQIEDDRDEPDEKQVESNIQNCMKTKISNRYQQ